MGLQLRGVVPLSPCPLAPPAVVDAQCGVLHRGRGEKRASRLLKPEPSISLASASEAGGLAESALYAFRTVVAFGGQQRSLRAYEAALKEADAVGRRLSLAMSLSVGTNAASGYAAVSIGMFAGCCWLLQGSPGGGGGNEPPVSFAIAQVSHHRDLFLSGRLHDTSTTTPVESRKVTELLGTHLPIESDYRWPIQ